jgi:hypothetical protein
MEVWEPGQGQRLLPPYPSRGYRTLSHEYTGTTPQQPGVDIIGLCDMVGKWRPGLLWLLFAAKTMTLFLARDFETLLLLVLLMVMLVLPAVLTGDGGPRFRLPFKHFLVIFGFSVLFKARKQPKTALQTQLYGFCIYQ